MLKSCFLQKKEKELESNKNITENSIKPTLPSFASDLIQSIESFRKTDLLGFILIAGRVIRAIIDKIRSELAKEAK